MTCRFEYTYVVTPNWFHLLVIAMRGYLAGKFDLEKWKDGVLTPNIDVI